MTRHNQRPPQPDELEGLASDIVYEFVMLRNTMDWCLEARSEREKETGTRGVELSMRADAYLESFLTHARNLTHFFISEMVLDGDGNRERDDIYATDYSDEWAPNGADLEVLRATVRSVNKRVHHITAYRQRVPKSDDQRDIFDIRDSATAVWNRFTEDLTPLMQQWFEVPTPSD